MSSRPADARVAARPPLARRRWRPSIKTRLALLFAGCTFGVLLVAIVLLYWAMTLSIAHDDQRLLAEKIHVLRTMLAERPHDPGLLNEEVDWETGVLGHARYFVQILDHGGRVIAETPGFRRSGISAGAFPAPIDLSAGEPRPALATTADGRRYLLAAADARLGASTTPQRVVRIAFDVSHEDRILADFRNIAGLVLLAGVVLAAGIGIEIARRGLAPLGEMTDTVQATTISQLQRRVDASQWPAELTELARAFNRMLAGLDDAVGRLSSYSSDLAHELRTPLNNLMGETEVILARPRPAESYRETLESNLEECHRLARTIDNLLFLARAENPASHIQRRPLDAADELDDVIDFHSAAAEEAGVAMLRRGSATVHADRDLLRRAMSNLLSNAIAHTPPGGRVTVTVEARRETAVEIRVRDTGRGMGPSERERVFDRFYRGETTRRDSAGAGLGLAIVRSIMELHGGRIDLQSAPGEGSVFTLSFPADDGIVIPASF